jgi:hypothetical protein
LTSRFWVHSSFCGDSLIGLRTREWEFRSSRWSRTNPVRNLSCDVFPLAELWWIWTSYLSRSVVGISQMNLEVWELLLSSDLWFPNFCSDLMLSCTGLSWHFNSGLLDVIWKCELVHRDADLLG